MSVNKKVPLVDVCVIGGGVGGLTTACLLANEVKHRPSADKNPNFHIVVLEKNGVCGGRMGSHHLYSGDSTSNHSYRFDTGPSLLLLPKTYEETFTLLGENIHDHLKLVRMRPSYRCFFESADLPSAGYDIDNLKEKSTEEYFQVSKAFLDFGLPNVIEEKLTLFGLPAFLVACLKTFPLLSHHRMLQQYFTSPLMQAAMSFQNLYVGLSPYNAPAIFSLLQALEYDQGIYYPVGGFGKISEALTAIALKLGVDVRTNSLIRNITTNESGCVSDVLVEERSSNGHFDVDASSRKHDMIYSLQSRIFLSNIDVPSGEFYLPEGYQDKRAKFAVPSCAVLQFNFALNEEICELTHHSIFFSKERRSSWRYIEEPDDPTAFDVDNFNFYVHAPARSDDSVCPTGHDALTILVPVPPLTAHAHGPQIVKSASDSLNQNSIQKIRNSVLDRIQATIQPSNDSLTGYRPRVLVRDCIVTETIRTPRDWDHDFGLFRGSAFGIRHSLDQLSILRPNIRHPHLRNLYRVGSSTRPGNGVPLVMIGARLTAKTILRDMGLKSDS